MEEEIDVIKRNKFDIFKEHATSSIATLVLTIFMLRTDVLAISNDELDNAYQRLSQLEASQLILNERLLNQQREIVDLRSQLNIKFNPSEYIGKFLDAIESPAWVKVWDGKDFRMLYINDAYTQYFGISRYKYKNMKDDDVYPSEVANVYRENDLAVLRNKGFTTFVETIKPKGQEPREVEIWKFYFLLPDKREAVGGVIID